MNRQRSIPIIAGSIVGGIIALAFFYHAAYLYSQTPSDPQKAIGYIFIAMYSAVIGAASYGAVYTGVMIPSVLHNRMKALGLFILSLASAIAAVLLVIYSPK